jgi:hypothetical protein
MWPRKLEQVNRLNFPVILFPFTAKVPGFFGFT